LIENYIKTAYRNLRRNGVYSVINVLGLSIGLTCSMLILIYVYHEFSYDRFHKNAEHIYRLGRKVVSAEGEIREPLSSAPSGRMLLQDFPEIVDVCRLKEFDKTVVSYSRKQFYEKEIYYADPSVFEVFTFTLIQGDPGTALLNPYSVVITRKIAEKYFGDREPVGNVLVFNNSLNFVVTGVIENLPTTSHLEINMLCSIETLYSQNDPGLINWLSFEYFTYLLLDENADYKALQLKFRTFIKSYLCKDTDTDQGTLEFYLVPLKKIYLFSYLDGDPPGLISLVILYILLAVLLTLIVCFNFMNLIIARSTTRIKEIGLRKVNGASKLNLVIQFLSESILMSIIALLIAYVSVKLLLPAFCRNVEEQLTLSFGKIPELYIAFLLLALTVGFIAGSYPTYYLSQFQPAQMMKNVTFQGKKRTGFRSVLVIVQFILSIILVNQTVLLNYQLTFLRNKDPGFEKKNVVVLPVFDQEMTKSLNLFKKEIRNQPGILNVGACSALPGLNIPREVKIPEGFGKDELQLMEDINIDNDFIPTLKIKLISGRNFSEEYTTDQKEGIIINQLAAKKFGWNDPVGRTIQYGTSNDQYATGMIIGVVKDFHLSSMHRLIEPLYISNQPGQLNYILIRIKPEQSDKTIKRIEEKWNAIYPSYPFQYSFLEDTYDHYFLTVEKVIDMLSVISVLAIILASIGIFSLASFITNLRTKEIGIRKTLGDTTLNLVFMFQKELLKNVGIAILIYIPYAFLTRNLMNDFLPYMTNTSLFLYIKVTGLIFAPAFISVLNQSVRSAMANPIELLRNE
jgi:putative ABC transport system permease protein